MKDLAELAIQNFCSYENFDLLGPINSFKKLGKVEKFHFKNKKLKIFIIMHSFLPGEWWRLPGETWMLPGEMNVPKRGSTLYFMIFVYSERKKRSKPFPDASWKVSLEIKVVFPFDVLYSTNWALFAIPSQKNKRSEEVKKSRTIDTKWEQSPLSGILLLSMEDTFRSAINSFPLWN